MSSTIVFEFRIQCLSNAVRCRTHQRGCAISFRPYLTPDVLINQWKNVRLSTTTVVLSRTNLLHVGDLDSVKCSLQPGARPPPNWQLQCSWNSFHSNIPFLRRSIIWKIVQRWNLVFFPPARTLYGIRVKVNHLKCYITQFQLLAESIHARSSVWRHRLTIMNECQIDKIHLCLYLYLV